MVRLVLVFTVALMAELIFLGRAYAMNCEEAVLQTLRSQGYPSHYQVLGLQQTFDFFAQTLGRSGYKSRTLLSTRYDVYLKALKEYMLVLHGGGDPRSAVGEMNSSVRENWILDVSSPRSASHILIYQTYEPLGRPWTILIDARRFEAVALDVSQSFGGEALYRASNLLEAAEALRLEGSTRPVAFIPRSVYVPVIEALTKKMRGDHGWRSLLGAARMTEGQPVEKTLEVYNWLSELPDGMIVPFPGPWAEAAAQASRGRASEVQETLHRGMTEPSASSARTVERGVESPVEDPLTPYLLIDTEGPTPRRWVVGD